MSPCCSHSVVNFSHNQNSYVQTKKNNISKGQSDHHNLWPLTIPAKQSHKYTFSASESLNSDQLGLNLTLHVLRNRVQLWGTLKSDSHSAIQWEQNRKNKNKTSSGRPTEQRRLDLAPSQTMDGAARADSFTLLRGSLIPHSLFYRPSCLTLFYTSWLAAVCAVESFLSGPESINQCVRSQYQHQQHLPWITSQRWCSSISKRVVPSQQIQHKQGSDLQPPTTNSRP